eukprot:6895249-Prymnesium_polylepis.1
MPISIPQYSRSWTSTRRLPPPTTCSPPPSSPTDDTGARRAQGRAAGRDGRPRITEVADPQLGLLLFSSAAVERDCRGQRFA